MTTGIKQPQSFNLLIFQSHNQESFNQRITQSTNQPIKKASAQRSDRFRAKLIEFRLLPGEGQSNPKTQTTRGGGRKSSASGMEGRGSTELLSASAMRKVCIDAS